MLIKELNLRFESGNLATQGASSVSVDMLGLLIEKTSGWNHDISHRSLVRHELGELAAEQWNGHLGWVKYPEERGIRRSGRLALVEIRVCELPGWKPDYRRRSSNKPGSRASHRPE